MRRPILLLLILLSITFAATAQVKLGVRGGANFSKLDIEDKNVSSSTGWFVGPTLELMIPVVKIGIEGSLLYSRLSSDVNSYDKINVDYLSLPIHLKWKLPIPKITPFVFTGPEFSVRVGDNIKDAWNDLVDNIDFNGTNVVYNVGAGIEFFNKVQVSLSYNAGLSNAFKHFDSKTRNWQLGGTIYF
ncbi:MAG: porin family protein [Bacteroidales bacterium]|nr:porin family protein [Bacteroidales bacterium]